MTESEEKLFKLAAKAACHDVVRVADDGNSVMLFGVQEPWNPRTDNGQAFELAMRTDICTRRIDPYVYAVGRTESKARIENGDIMSASREAVFMAAVEVGKAKK